MKKTIIIVIVLCIALLFVYATAIAQSEDDYVVINPPFSDPVRTASTNQEIIVRTGWAACTKGLVRSYITAAHHDWYLDDVPLFSSPDEMVEHWGPIVPWVSPNIEYCIAGNEKTASKVYIEYNLGTLEVGEYDLRAYHWLDHPVTDGYDADGDGRPDLHKDFRYDVTIHIIVESP
jgi:hypothetical protein